MIEIIFGLYIVVPLIFIIMNAMAMARHRTNKICALAIIAAMLSVMINALANIASGATHINLNTLDVLVHVKMSLDIVAIVLGAIGIIQCLIKRRYVKGRWRAIIAVLISGAYTYVTAVRILEGHNRGIAWTQLLRPQATGGKPVVNAAWNFQITPPSSWNEVSTQAFPLARVAFKHKTRDMYSLVFVEDLPDGSEFTLADYMDLQKKIIRENTKGAEFFGEEEFKEGVFTVRTLEMRGKELFNPVFSVYWILRDGNTMYRITTHGPNSQAKEVREEARKILRGFDLIEHRNKPKSTPKPTVAILPALRLP
jgi:hypothetical protein